jgi:hypothetical protein
MVGVAAECAVQQAKSSHTAVPKSSQPGQRRANAGWHRTSEAQSERNISAGLGLSPSEEKPDPLVQDTQTGKEHDTRNALPLLLYEITKRSWRKLSFQARKISGCAPRKDLGGQVPAASSWVGRVVQWIVPCCRSGATRLNERQELKYSLGPSHRGPV